MPRPARPTLSDNRPRFHYIPEWATHRHMRQSDISRELGVDKSTTFRWFEGSIPAEKHLLALSDLFVCEVTDLFRHPDDDWMARFLRERKGDYTDDDREKLRSLVDLVLPKKVA